MKKNKQVGLIVVFAVLVLVLIVMIASCRSSGSSSSSSSGQSNDTAQAKTYGPGETWTVDGQWSLTIDSVTATDERNAYSDKNPAQVVVVTYSYNNLGYTSDVQDLYFGDGDFKVLDAGNAVASSYPGNITTYAQATPVGASCNGAQACYGLDNASDQITLTVSQYDSNHKKQEASFVLPVQ